MLDIVLALIYFALIGWVVHRIMGCDGGVLHFVFVGGCGSGLGALLEWITNIYTKTFFGAIALCIVYSCIVEYIIRRIKHQLWVREVHKKGWLTQEDIDKEFCITKNDLKGFEDVELEDEDK